MFIKNNSYLQDLGFLKSSKNLKVGIFGGSFNPPHIGHKNIAYEALKRINLDVLLIFVTPQNPLKNTQNSLQNRLKATKQMFNFNTKIKILKTEESLGSNYTANLIKHIKQISNPTNKFYFIMGQDNGYIFTKFKNWQYIAKNIPLCIFTRYNKSNLLNSYIFNTVKNHNIITKSFIDKQELPCVNIFLIPYVDISSTKIRQEQEWNKVN